MKVYHASIYGNKHGEFIDVIYSFTLPEFNAGYMECQNEFYCHPSYKTIIDFDDNISQQDIIDKLYKYGIRIMKSQMPIDELIKKIEEINNEYHFNTCKEEDFEHISSDEFFSRIKPSQDFAMDCVKTGVKSSVSV